MATKTVDVELATVNCCCGGVYAITERVRAYHQEKGTCWTCPYCQCSWGFAGNGRVQQLEKELARAHQRIDQVKADADWQKKQRQATERQLSAQRGVTTRIKNRVKNGVCPCCNRHFENLERHMKGQHPEYAATAE